jgi:hypothetical protein
MARAKRPGARRTKGTVQLGLELEPELVARMRALAEGNHRSLREEVEHAFRRHLERPPVRTYTETVPGLGAAEVVAPGGRTGRASVRPSP